MTPAFSLLDRAEVSLPRAKSRLLRYEFDETHDFGKNGFNSAPR
jgi:hypothetical protein